MTELPWHFSVLLKKNLISCLLKIRWKLCGQAWVVIHTQALSSPSFLWQSVERRTAGHRPTEGHLQLHVEYCSESYVSPRCVKTQCKHISQTSLMQTLRILPKSPTTSYADQVRAITKKSSNEHPGHAARSILKPEQTDKERIGRMPTYWLYETKTVEIWSGILWK